MSDMKFVHVPRYIAYLALGVALRGLLTSTIDVSFDDMKWLRK